MLCTATGTRQRAFCCVLFMGHMAPLFAVCIFNTHENNKGNKKEIPVGPAAAPCCLHRTGRRIPSPPPDCRHHRKQTSHPRWQESSLCLNSSIFHKSCRYHGGDVRALIQLQIMSLFFCLFLKQSESIMVWFPFAVICISNMNYVF